MLNNFCFHVSTTIERRFVLLLLLLLLLLLVTN